MLLIPATSSMSLCSSFISTSSEKILAFRSFQLFLRRFFLLPFHVFVIEPLLMNPWCLAFVCRPMHCNVETFCVVILCHCFNVFFVVSFLFRSLALVEQVQICWCPQWLEEANFSACKIHLCRERLFHHRILDNQNIARLVNSRVNLGDFAKNHKALYCSYRTSNPSQSVGYHYARRVKTPQALSQGWIKSEEAQRVGQAPYCHH